MTTAVPLRLGDLLADPCGLPARHQACAPHRPPNPLLGLRRRSSGRAPGPGPGSHLLPLFARPRPAEQPRHRRQAVAAIAGGVLWPHRTAIRTATGSGARGFVDRSRRRSLRRRGLQLRAHPQVLLRTRGHRSVLADPLTDAGCGWTRIPTRTTIMPPPARGMVRVRRRKPSTSTKHQTREQAPSHRRRQQNLAPVVLVLCSPAPRCILALRQTRDRRNPDTPRPARIQTAPPRQRSLRTMHPQGLPLLCLRGSRPLLVATIKSPRQVCPLLTSRQCAGWQALRVRRSFV